MERIKVGLLAVIAGALVVLAGERLVPEAHAQSSGIVCEAWLVEPIIGPIGKENKRLQGRAYADEVREWLRANPGQPVFRSSIPVGTLRDYIDVMCVR